MRTYFLWLEPSGTAHERLAETIGHLSREHGGPLFDPHVTLLGDLAGEETELSRRTGELARALPPIDLTLAGPAYQNQYFRCVFMRVKETPSLLEAHTLARQVFTKEDAPPYMPHVSLLYGVYPTSLKERIVATVPASLNLRFTASAVTLLRAEGTNPNDWHRVQTSRLGGRQSKSPTREAPHD